MCCNRKTINENILSKHLFKILKLISVLVWPKAVMVFSLWQNFKLKFYTICTFQTVRPEECRWRNLESEMGKKDLTDMLGGGGGRTRQKYRCKADGCQVTPMGVNLAKHYNACTDWVLFNKLKACVGDKIKNRKHVWRLAWYADFKL